ncbi:MAG: 2-C-methyl-D-erythritol 2,4-cyclodiphosphate synthase [Clostridia bacterium]|nr:2-C-methyl-D-erythritol 2,4-cyclodiphosphate synthase [Clostridia bacterium]
MAGEPPEGFDVRVGFGIDVHRFAEGRRLVLGGVEIPHDRGLLGHSDADVVTHAIMDALLGAAALGDIGLHFPDSDAAYAGADSLALLSRVRRLVEAEGWSVRHVDVMVLAEEPRLRPHVEAMRRRLADALGVAPERVSVKATTTEGLGAVGRAEGIRAEAVATLIRWHARGKLGS